MLKSAPAPDHAKLSAIGREYAAPELPEMFRAMNAELEPGMAERFPFDPEHLKQEARNATGLADFGDWWFDEGLAALCMSLDTEIDWSGFGRWRAYEDILKVLSLRLRLEDLWKRKPEIADRAIERPIFVLGLPRSGTTFLQQLLAEDPHLRGIPLWEELFVLPDHDPAIRPPDDAPLIARTDESNAFVRAVAPKFFDMHQFETHPAAEDIHLMDLGFTGSLSGFRYCAPSYREWRSRQDRTESYRYLKRVLQTLGWMRGGARFLLKAPEHMNNLRFLLAVFPDAVLVQTHRDPAAVAGSLASLQCYLHRVYSSRPNPLVSGALMVSALETYVEDMMRDRADGDERFFDIQFRQLMSDPLGVVRALYRSMGDELSAEAQSRMEAFVDDNRKNKHKRHDYVLSDFGLEAAALRESFRAYCKRFDVPEEVAA